MPRESQACVRLQRVPPEIRILTPGRLFFSTSSVFRPRSAARVAASNPAAPAPTTTTSQSGIRFFLEKREPNIRSRVVHPLDVTNNGQKRIGTLINTNRH